MLKVSIITVCYNSADTIEYTIQSVISQEYENIEYIIIDGKSNDDTLKIIEKYKSKVSKLLSENDEGIYYAVNKGIKLATGDIIAILHADDIYTSRNIVSKVVKKFDDLNVDTVYRDLAYVGRNNTQHQ